MKHLSILAVLCILFSGCAVKPVYKSETVQNTDSIAYVTPTIVIESDDVIAFDYKPDDEMRKSVDSLFSKEVKKLQVTQLIENYDVPLHNDIKGMFDSVRKDTFPEVPQSIKQLEVPEDTKYLLLFMVYKKKQTITNYGNYSYYKNECYVAILKSDTKEIVFLDRLDEGYYLETLKTSLKKFKSNAMVATF